MVEHFQRHLWLSILSILLVIGVFGVGMWRLNNEIQTRIKQITIQRAMIFKGSQISTLLAQYKKTLPLAQGYERLIDMLLPAVDKLFDFPKWLDDLSRIRQVAMRFNFQGEQVAASGSMPGYVRFNIDSDGPYDNLFLFFKDIEVQSPKFLIGVDGVEIVRTEDAYRMLLQGRVYFK